MECGCSSSGLMPIENAQALITELIREFLAKPAIKNKLSERVLLTDAVDRVLSEDVVSPLNVPAYDNSAMDGYAIRSADLSKHKMLKQIGKSFAGLPFEGKVGEAQCVRIMTGAQIPKGADAVVMQENALVHRDEHDEIKGIEITKCSGKGEAIRPAGDDIQQGATVLAKGTRITPVGLGVLASLGLKHVNVFPKLKVAVFSTGDELLSLGSPLESGKIYDSNRPMLVAMLKRLGVEVLDLGLIKDSKDAITEAFLYADTHADCVITSGGVSVGEADYTREVLDEMGKIDFWKLAIKPGKPLAFGRLANSLFFGLPGNPVSAAVTFDQIAVPALKALSGEHTVEPARFVALAGQNFKKRPGRTDYQRGHFTRNENNQLVVTSARSQSSGVLSSFCTSNCYIVLEQERASVNKGEPVTILPFEKPLL
uniref:molybdopterin molybdotransferase MoeA n=1 Tax=Ningiella ruwaisensis TaxID=2364274 RepID=UPI00109F6FFD|nr:gephyrin-like molybdotransferase Glp [Ningiella ruwaisensis]